MAIMVHYTVVLIFFSLSPLSSFSGDSVALRTVNVDQAYARWNRAGIPFYIDANFTQSEASMIRAAITAVQMSLPSIGASPCLSFVEVPSSVPVFKLKFTPLTGGPGSQSQTYCYSFPGVNLALQQTGMEQIISLARGPSGCMASSCTIQKYIALVLGKRNEHQRGDRDTYITINPANLLVPSAYQTYTSGDAYWALFPYDYCSVTHNQPTDFAYVGTQAFSFPANSAFHSMPQTCGLSQTDCKLISLLYNCPSSACLQPACTSASIAATTTTTSTTSTTTATTTVTGTTATSTPTTLTTATSTTTSAAATCNIDFCTAPIDEGAMLLDLRQVIFSGTCFAEIDPTTQKVKAPTTGGQPISSIFPGITGPVQAVWTTSNTPYRGDATVQHVLLPNGVQYACTVTGCTPETARVPNNPKAVFEFTNDMVTYAEWSIEAGGTTTFTDDLTHTPTQIQGLACQAGCSDPLTTWSAGWSSGEIMTAIIGKNAAGVSKIQHISGVQMIDQWQWEFVDASAPYC